MDTANCYRMSDPALNRQFSRPWSERPRAQPRPAPVRAPAAEPAVVTLARERDEWLRCRAAPAPRKGAAR